MKNIAGKKSRSMSKAKAVLSSSPISDSDHLVAEKPGFEIRQSAF
jgi:hypothetical protein